LEGVFSHLPIYFEIIKNKVCLLPENKFIEQLESIIQIIISNRLLKQNSLGTLKKQIIGELYSISIDSLTRKSNSRQIKYIVSVMFSEIDENLVEVKKYINEFTFEADVNNIIKEVSCEQISKEEVSKIFLEGLIQWIDEYRI